MIFKRIPKAGQCSIESSYSFWSKSVFIAIYAVYFVSYLARKNFPVVMQDIQETTNLGNAALGLIGSAFYIAYGVGKFVNGMIADRLNLKFLLPLCLIVSSGLGALMPVCLSSAKTQSAVVTMLVIVWGLNGWFQSFAFPLCAKALTFWFCSHSRGRVWSWWATSHELGEASVGFILLPFVEMFGWKSGFYFPAIASLMVGVLAFFCLQDRPEAIGLPSVEDICGRHEEISEESNEREQNYFELLKKHVFTNKTLWILAFSFVFVNILRCGIIDWVLKFFKEVGDTRALATLKASIIPASGILGVVSIPIVSECFFGGRRAPANFFYLITAAASLLGTICILNHGVEQVTTFERIGLFTCLMLLGAGTCGPLTTIGGICSVESSSKKVAAAATGFTGMAGYVGAASCSYITGYLKDAQWVKDRGIDFVEFWFWMFAAIIAAVLCLLLWNKKSKDI